MNRQQRAEAPEPAVAVSHELAVARYVGALVAAAVAVEAVEALEAVEAVEAVEIVQMAAAQQVSLARVLLERRWVQAVHSYQQRMEVWEKQLPVVQIQG